MRPAMSVTEIDSNEIAEERECYATQHTAVSRRNARAKVRVTEWWCSSNSGEQPNHQAEPLNSIIPEADARKNNASKYVCRLCIRDFRDAASLGCHIQAHHPRKHVPRKSAREHSTRQHRLECIARSLYNCHLCLDSFGDAASLGEHVCIAHSGKLTQRDVELFSNLEMRASGDPVKTLDCPFCPGVFQSKPSLRYHIQRKHFKIGFHDAGPCTSKQSRDAERVPTTKRFKCHLCSKQFKDRDTRRHHCRNVHTADREEHSRKRRVYPCKRCSKTFDSKDRLTRHVSKHSGRVSLSCHLCRAVFLQKEHLTQHLQTHHVEKPFGCPHCDKRFLLETEMRTHVRTHKRNRKYACNYCPAKFSAQDSLQKHVTRHTGIKPSACPKCPLRFARTKDLERHYSTQHPEERQFICAVCLETFTLDNLLRVHMKPLIKVYVATVNSPLWSPRAPE